MIGYGVTWNDTRCNASGLCDVNGVGGMATMPGGGGGPPMAGVWNANGFSFRFAGVPSWPLPVMGAPADGVLGTITEGESLD